MSAQPSVPSGRWRFGQFELDLSTRELRKNGLRIHLQEQQARILEALLDRPGELVTREVLRERLWPADTFVDFERSLNAAVAKLRQVLTDSAEQPRYVETVARRGYRFIAPIEASLRLGETAAMPAVAKLGETKPGMTDDSFPRSKRKQWIWPVTVAASLALASVVIYRISPKAVSVHSPAVRFVVTPPEGTKIHPMSAISPDGSKLAFVAVDNSGRRKLWLRALDAEAIHLENTDDAAMPFFSPDSQHIGFFANGKLKRIPTSGGAPQTLCGVHQPAGGTWNRDNVIVFSQSGRLYQVVADGGDTIELARPVTAAGENNIDTWPQFLPDGRRFIVSTATHKGHIDPIRSSILLGAINSSNRKLLVNAYSRGALTPSGHLLFRRDDALVAQKLDLRRDELVGKPRVVAQDLNRASAGIQVDVKAGLAVGVLPAPFSASDNAVLVYHYASPSVRQLVWFNREGKRLGTAGELRDYMQIFISPDEQWAAVSIRHRVRPPHWNIWLLHLKTNVLSRLSSGEGRDADPAWGPGSDRVVYGVYRADKGENIDLMEALLGERASKQIYSDGHSNKSESWSPDGRFLLFRRNEQTLVSLPMLGDRKPSVLLHTPHIKQGFQFSPDGHWVAYSSSDSGRSEIYISRFPAMTGTRQISAESGYAPVWRKDGKELFYMTEQGHVMAVAMKVGAKMEAGAPTLLFRPDIRFPNMPQFGVIDDGHKFLVIEAPPERTGDERMVVQTHWDASMRQ